MKMQSRRVAEGQGGLEEKAIKGKEEKEVNEAEVGQQKGTGICLTKQ